MRRGVGLALVLITGACGFDSSGVGSSTATNDDASASEPTGSASTGEPTDPTDSDSLTDSADTTPPADTSSSDSSADTGESSGTVVLVLTDAPIFDFPDVTPGDVETHGFELRNEGTAAATNLGASVDAAPFAFAGAPYPGEGGTCTDTLAPATSCVLVLAFAPTQWGSATAALSITYEGPGGANGSIAAMLRARSIGESDNLVVNGDAEQFGSPPPGWSFSEGSGDHWETTTTEQYSGTASIWAGEGPGINQFRLRQDIDVEDWSELVDAGELQVRLQARTRSYEAGNDPHHVRLRFFDEDDDLLEEEISPTYSGAEWRLVDLAAPAPPSTRRVQVQLRCALDGGDYCDGYFDEITLVVAYE